MRRVYSSPDAAMVHLVKNALENQKIAATIRREHLVAAAGGVAPIDAWVELWVLDDAQFEAAQAIVAEATTESEPPGEIWICADCGEEIEPQFAVCWNCGAEPR